MLPPSRAMNLPSLTVSIEQMIAATRRQAGDRALGTVHFAPDTGMQEIVDGWPRAFVSDVASRLGIAGDRSIDDIVSEYLAG
jgi:hypothetical protein